MRYKRTRSKAQAAKTKFRRSSRWIKFRKHMKAKQDGKCFVTGAKLTRTANLHHICMDPDKYEDLTNEDNFVYLSLSSHRAVHWLWGQGNNNWRERIQKLVEILERMEKANGVQQKCNNEVVGNI